MFICMGFCVGALLYLLWLEHRHSIPLNDVNMLLIELSVAFIATWIVPIMYRCVIHRICKVYTQTVLIPNLTPLPLLPLPSSPFLTVRLSLPLIHPL